MYFCWLHLLCVICINSVFKSESRITTEALNVSIKINNTNTNQSIEVNSPQNVGLNLTSNTTDGIDHQSKAGLGLLPVCKCGVTNAKKRIVEGDVADYDEYPWQAIFYYNKQFFCGGSLINNRYILSSAYCFADFTRDEYEHITVRLLAPELDEENVDTIERQISKIHLHSEYDSITNDNDISLIRIEDPVQFSIRSLLRPICLPDHDEEFDGEHGIVTGYGSKAENSTIPSMYLLKQRVPIYSTKHCRTKTGYLSDEISQNMFCAGYLDGESGPCHRDRGGPLQVATGRRDNRYVQAGIVSFAEYCAVPNYPTVYTKVSNYLKWIERITSDAAACLF